MSGVTCAWSSHHPDVGKAFGTYLDEVNTRRAATAVIGDTLRADLSAWLNARDASLDLMVRDIDNVACGIRLTGTDELPVGWRYKASEDMLVPDRRTRSGKLYARALRHHDTLPRPQFALPGLPLTTFGWMHAGMRYSPGAFELDGVIWTGWGVPAEHQDRLAEDIDGALWTRRPLSEYWAASEELDRVNARAKADS
ncbi:MAG: hypothetical protein AAGA90_20490 [Actinomycetota bacterium]